MDEETLDDPDVINCPVCGEICSLTTVSYNTNYGRCLPRWNRWGHLTRIDGSPGTCLMPGKLPPDKWYIKLLRWIVR